MGLVNQPAANFKARLSLSPKQTKLEAETRAVIGTRLDAARWMFQKNRLNLFEPHSVAGQHFARRPLFRATAKVIQTKPSDTLADPACGAVFFQNDTVTFVL